MEAPQSSSPNQIRMGGQPNVAIHAAAVGRVETPLSPELAALVERAAWIGQGDGPSPLASFTSLFLALFVGSDEVSLWVQEKATWIGPDLDDVIRKWTRRSGLPGGLDKARVLAARERPLTDGATPVPRSASVDRLVGAAEDIARNLGDASPLLTRHVFAAYLYAPGGHGDDFKAWRFDREAWATRFRAFVTEVDANHAESWRELHESVFPRHAFSIGVRESLSWAASLARARDSAATAIDSRDLLGGLLLDGLTHLNEPVMSAELVKALGGAQAVGALVSTVDTVDTLTRSSLDLPFADELQAVLDRAHVFATATRGEPRQLHVRHLLAGLLTDRRPLAAFELLRRARRTSEGALARLRTHVAKLDKAHEDVDLWPRLLDEHREDVVAGYDNDEAHGEDRLDIGPDVRALAAVLASTDVSPPLSLGLFGDWGSGKSFFMAKLRERIRQLADAAATRPGKSWFCGKKGKVVQIDFNAWHYMDADLWSSLAVRVFDKLSDEFKADFARACLNELDTLKERQKELVELRAGIDERVRQLGLELDREVEQRQQRKLQLAELAQAFAASLKRRVTEDPTIQRATTHLRLSAESGRADLEAVQHDLASLGGQLERWWAFVRGPWYRVVGVVGLVAATLGVHALAPKVLPGLAAYGAAAAAATAALAAAWRSFRAYVAPAEKLVGDAIGELARIEDELRARKSQEESALEVERDRFSARVADLEREQSGLQKRRIELEVQLAKLEDPSSIKDFVLERAAADDYRKKLGVVSTVHRDFQQLARFLAPGGQTPNVERIILYIDDLDRCAPARVVEVLQAVHVILSLPLFVVVVGVDSRWLLESLETYYQRQFPRRGRVPDTGRPQQYLEKIFQIPFTLMPMTPEGYSALVGSMLDRHVDGAPEAADEGAPAPEEGTGVKAGAARPAAVAASGTRRAVADVPARINLTPRSLRLKPAELAYMQKLSTLIGSPRTAKRLANLYRIVRATLDDDALDALIAGDYKLTQICLAMVLGHPSHGRDLFADILSKKLGSRTDLNAWFTGREHKASDVRERAFLRGLRAHEAEFAEWASAETAVRRVARFSFETGRVLGL